jgi:hypothetical protein
MREEFKEAEERAEMKRKRKSVKTTLSLEVKM